MKKSVLFLFVFLLFSFPAQATVDSIYEYLERVDNQHFLVVGTNGKGGDTLAAIDVAIGLKQHSRSGADIEPVVESDIGPTVSKILIGHPCDNSLIDIKCEEWAYRPGEAIIKVMGNDLVVAGTTVDDTRSAAKILKEYPKHSLLKRELSVVVTARGTRPQSVQKQKSELDFVCGDLVCEPGELLSCFIDCAELTCFEICQQEGFDNAACRDKKTHPDVPSCSEGETNRGLGYCAESKVCCCEKTDSLPKEPKESVPTPTPTEKSSFYFGEVIVLGILILIALGVVALLAKKKV